MALGKTRIFDLARLAGCPQFARCNTLTVAEAERVAAELPGWWRQMWSAQRREARRVLAELMVTRGMMPLLMKARNGEQWTAQEKEELLSHLRRMVHLSPYLIALLMPGSVLLLPAYAWWLDRRRLKRGE